MSVAQKPIRLDQPIDVDAPPTIYSTKLTPELSNAALNLTIDFQRQKQSLANQKIFNSPISIAVVLLATSAFGYWKIGWIIERGGLTLLKKNLGELFPVLIFLTMFGSVFFTLTTRQTDIIRTRADSIAEDSTPIFGFDLKEFIKINPKNKKLDKASRALLGKGENSNIVIYRDSPIAIITLDKIDDLSDKDKTVIKITGVGVRKVYYKSGIVDDLFDWAIKRAGEINEGKAPKVLILTQVLSVDKALKSTLRKRQFQLIETKTINDSKILKLFGISYEVWGLGLNVQKLDDIKEKLGSTGVFTAA